MKVMQILTSLIVIAGCVQETSTSPTVETESITWNWSSSPYQHVGTVVASSPFPIGDSLVLMSAGPNIRMHNQITGDLLWETFIDSGTNIQSGIFATDGELIFGTHVRDVRAWSIESGDMVWRTDFPDDVGTFEGDDIAYEGGRIYAAGFHTVYCLDGGTGRLLWSNIVGDSTAVNDLAIHNGRLYAGTGGFKPKGVFILDMETGETLNNYIINNGVGKVVMAPIFEDSIMYVATSWQMPFSIEAWNIITHEKIWHIEKANHEYIADHAILAHDLIVVSLAPYGIGAWNRYTGEQVWITYPTQNYNWGRIGFDGNWLYYQHGWKIQVIEPETGEVVYSRNGPDGESVYHTSVSNGLIFTHSAIRNMCFSIYLGES